MGLTAAPPVVRAQYPAAQSRTRVQPRLSSALALLAFGLIVPAAGCSIILASTSSANWDLTAFMYLVITVYSGARLAMLATAREARFLGIAFFMFTYVWLGFAAFAQTVSQRFTFIQPSVNAQVEAALIIFAGILAYDAGQLARRYRQRGCDATIVNATRRLDPRRVRIAGWIVVLTSPLAIARLGGLDILFSNRNAADLALYPSGVANGVALAPGEVFSGTLIRDASTVVAFVVLLAWICVLRSHHESKQRWSSADVALLIGLIVMNVALNSPFSNARFWFGTVCIALVLLVRFFNAVGGRLVFVSVLLLSVVFVLPVANYFRYAPGVVPLFTGSVQTLETLGDYDAAAEVGATVDYVHSAGFANGAQLLGAAAFWVPRQLWPGKPQDTGLLLGYYYGTATPNISAPLWAEGYINFGWFGALVGLFAVGYGSEVLDRGWRLSRPGTDFRYLVLLVLTGYSFILLRGSLLQAMDRLTMMAVLLWVLTHRLRRRDQASSSASTRSTAVGGRVRLASPAATNDD